MVDIDGTDYWAFSFPFSSDYDRDGILDGSEKVTIKQLGSMAPRQEFEMIIEKADGSTQATKVLSRLDRLDVSNDLANVK